MIEKAINIILVEVYEDRAAAHALLYKLLEERNSDVNISHKVMPSWQQHIAFIDSRPYTAWYLIWSRDVYVGSIYLSRQDEIGLFILEDYRDHGYGKAALHALMARHVRSRYLANINPRNDRALQFLEGLGFEILHYMMELKIKPKQDG